MNKSTSFVITCFSLTYLMNCWWSAEWPCTHTASGATGANGLHKGLARLEQLSKERWHRGLIVLGMHNPCDLGQKDIYVLDKLHVLELCVPQLLAATTYDKGHNMI